MAKQYAALITTKGLVLIAAAINKGEPISITDLAVGDGNGAVPTPDKGQTALVNEVARVKLNSLVIDEGSSNQIIANGVIPAETGGFWMREVGLFTDAGDLFAVSALPPTYKTAPEEGATNAQNILMYIIVSDTSSVTLTVDNTVIMASQAYVDDLMATHEKSRNHPDGTTKAKGFVQLSSAVDSASEVLAATPKAVKAASDNADLRLKTANNLSDIPDAPKALENIGAFPSAGGTVTGETHFGALVHFDRHDAAVQFSSSGEGMPNIAISYSKAGNFGFWDVDNNGWVLRKDVDNNWIMYAGLSLNIPLPVKSGGTGASEPAAACENIGAIPLTGSLSISGLMRNSDEFQSTNDNSYRMVQGDYGTFWRMDGSSLYLMQTLAGDQYGTYDSSRPLRVNLADGMVEINGARPYSTANPPPAQDLSGYIHGDACNQAGFVSQNGDAPYMMFNGSTIVELARLPWVNDQISAVREWANGDLRNDIYNWCRQSFVTAVRLGSERVQVSTNDSGGVISLGGGELFTGAAGVGGSDFNKAQWRVRQLQYCINGQWIAAGSI